MGFIQDYVVAAAASYWVLPIIFALCCVDGFFPPFPSESILISLGSVAAATGQVHIVWVCIFGAFGAWFGDIIAYHVGRHIPIYRISFLSKGKGKKAVDRAERSLAERGVFLILVARFVPVGRIAVNMVAGATGFSRFKFICTSFFAAFIWSTYSIILGYGVGAVLHHSPILAIVTGILLGILSGALLDKIIVFIGGWLAKRIANNEMRFFRWVKVEDIANQGIPIDEDKVFNNKKSGSENIIDSGDKGCDCFEN